MGGELRDVALFGKSNAEILCSFNEHVFHLQILLCPCGDRPLAVVHAVRIGFLGSLSPRRWFPVLLEPTPHCRASLWLAPDAHEAALQATLSELDEPVYQGIVAAHSETKSSRCH
jgi:hypothetical protein